MTHKFFLENCYALQAFVLLLRFLPILEVVLTLGLLLDSLKPTTDRLLCLTETVESMVEL